MDISKNISGSKSRTASVSYLVVVGSGSLYYARHCEWQATPIF